MLTYGCSADLLDELAPLVPREITHFDRRCVSYELAEGGGVNLRFTSRDGSVTEDVYADVVLASDGIKSTLREQMYERRPELSVEDQRATYAEWIVWRGIVSKETFESAMGKGTDSRILHMGQGRHLCVVATPRPRLAAHSVHTGCTLASAVATSSTLSRSSRTQSTRS